jgi:exodeoxyribonuclease V alpha subunit
MTDITGHISKIIYKDTKENNNFFIILSIIDNNNNNIKIKGKIYNYPSINDYIITKGNFVKDNYGGSYDCGFIERHLPVDHNLIKLKIKDISKSLIKNKLNDKDMNILLDSNHNLWDSIKNKTLIYNKIKTEKIEILYALFTNYENQYDNDKNMLMRYLSNNNISLKSNQINNLLESYNDSKTIINIIENKLIDLINIDSFSIKTLINIAESLNFTEQLKLELIIIDKLGYNNDGHTCFVYKHFINFLSSNYKQFTIFINDVINTLLEKNLIVLYNEYIYYKEIYDTEYNIGVFLKNKYENDNIIDNRLIDDENIVYNESIIENKQINNNILLKDYYEDAKDFLDNYKGFKLNTEQHNSFLSIFKYNINITTGYAGTGKSEILIRLASFFSNYSEISILFLTPTGKASYRLTEGFKNNNIKMKSFTIHKFIYYLKSDIEDLNIAEFDKIIENKELIKIFVIDEMSMVCSNNFNKFINKIKDFKNYILFLLGDNNQLPSISYGDVLNQLILSNKFNVIKLHKICRSDCNGLLTAQNNILKQLSPIHNIVYSNSDNSFIWYDINPVHNKDFVFDTLKKIDSLPLILTSTNKIIDDYQNDIRMIFNTTINENSEYFEQFNIKYYINDYIMITKNNYQLELINGMIGKIISFEKDKDKNNVIIGFNVVFYNEDNHKFIKINESYKLAYLITIHKSQGSESDNVIILLDESQMNTINLLYTAITRAKSKCILISNSYTIESIIKLKKFTKRISNLKDFCN